jgi:hypothetical protein
LGRTPGRRLRDLRQGRLVAGDGGLDRADGAEDVGVPEARVEGDEAAHADAVDAGASALRGHALEAPPDLLEERAGEPVRDLAQTLAPGHLARHVGDGGRHDEEAIVASTRQGAVGPGEVRGSDQAAVVAAAEAQLAEAPEGVGQRVAHVPGEVPLPAPLGLAAPVEGDEDGVLPGRRGVGRSGPARPAHEDAGLAPRRVEDERALVDPLAVALGRGGGGDGEEEGPSGEGEESLWTIGQGRGQGHGPHGATAARRRGTPASFAHSADPHDGVLRSPPPPPSPQRSS